MYYYNVTSRIALVLDVNTKKMVTNSDILFISIRELFRNFRNQRGNLRFTIIKILQFYLTICFEASREQSISVLPSKTGGRFLLVIPRRVRDLETVYIFLNYQSLYTEYFTSIIITKIKYNNFFSFLN